MFHRSACNSLYTDNENQTEYYLKLFNVLKFYLTNAIRSVLMFKALTRRIRECNELNAALASNHDNY